MHIAKCYVAGPMLGDECFEPCAASLVGVFIWVGVAAVAARGWAASVFVLIPVEAIPDEQWPMLPVGIDDV